MNLERIFKEVLKEGSYAHEALDWDMGDSDEFGKLTSESNGK